MNIYYKGLILILVTFLYFNLKGQAPILVVDLDENNSSAPDIEQSLTNLAADFETATSIPGDLSQYEGIFVCLGIYSNNHVLTQNEGTQLADYLNNGGSLYMEGGDTWYFDEQTPVHSMFNILPLSDGTSDMGIVNGMEGTFTEGMSFNYTGENNWMDHIDPIAPAIKIFENQSPLYGTAVAYDAGDYKTIGAAHEFGGLADGSSPSTKDELMTAYLEFLDVSLAPEAAFSVSDTVICQTDIVSFYDESSGNVLTWEWTFEGGTPATSTQQNPVVAYPNSGNFDVLLEVSDGEITSSMYMPNYMQVGHVPQTGNTPSGISLLCAAWGNTTYNTTSLSGVSTYLWNLDPDTAGTVSGTGTSVTVVWSPDFLGTAELRVAGTNYCGTGAYSNPLTITRYLPEVSVVLPAYVALEDPPFELTGGTPSGGTYSGPGVSSGMFDPQAAGLGPHGITYTYTDLNLCSNSAVDTITVTEFIGVNEFKYSDGFSVYPNPSKGNFTLKIKAIPGEKANIRLYNAMGKILVENRGIELNAGYEENINIGKMPNGIYYLMVQGSSIEKVKKIVIRK